MKKYLLFCCDHCYPAGGALDFERDGDCLEDLIKLGYEVSDDLRDKFFHVVESETFKIAFDSQY